MLLDVTARPSVAERRNVYTPKTVKLLATVTAEVMFVKVIFVTGPLTTLHQFDRNGGRGSPSSVTEPSRKAVLPGAMMRLGPGFTTGGWLLNTVIIIVAEPCECVSDAVRTNMQLPVFVNVTRLLVSVALASDAPGPV